MIMLHNAEINKTAYNSDSLINWLTASPDKRDNFV
jgi:hypothetical protein